MRNIIHPTALIEPGVELGTDNYIGPHCLIKAGTKIGNRNRFEAFVSIGTPAEHRDYFRQRARGVVIGDDCTFREFVTINEGTNEATKICDRVVMLRGSHIGHDSLIEDDCNLACNVAIGGHSRLMQGANFGLNSVCHQYSVIGAYAMIGMGSVVTKESNISPGDIFVGSPAKYLKSNTIGLQRGAVSPEDLAKFYQEWITYTN